MSHPFNPSDDRGVDEALDASADVVPDPDRVVPVDIGEPDTGPPVIDDDDPA